MNVIDRILARRGYINLDKLKAESTPSFLQQTAKNVGYTIPDYGLADHQLRLYQMSSWVAEAAGYVSRYAAGIDFGVKQRIGEDTEDIINHPFEVLMSRPNPLQSRFRLMESTAANLLLAGNGWWYLNKASQSAPPLEIYSLPANRIKPIPGNKLGIVDGYEWDAGMGQTIRLEPWQVLHFAEYHPRNMYVGLSRVESIAVDAEKDLKAAKYELDFYGADNAKPEGILGWKGTMPDEIWEQTKARFSREFRGRNSIGLMQGVEDIKYFQLALNHADMEFIANRNFTKEQIYNHFAPGLASVLSVNATEANARSGKATLMEFGVFPLLEAIAQGITNTILPLYGDNLVGEFEEVRLSDRAMEHQEQDRAALVMTVNEFRATYYNLEPLADERGDKLVKGPGMTPPQLQPFSGGNNNDDSPRFLETGGQQGDDQQDVGQTKARPIVIDVQPQEARPTPQQAVRDELDAYRRFFMKRWKAGKTGEDMRAFEAEYIPPALKGALDGALEMARSIEDAAWAFDDAARWYQGA